MKNISCLLIFLFVAFLCSNTSAFSDKDKYVPAAIKCFTKKHDHKNSLSLKNAFPSKIFSKKRGKKGRGLGSALIYVSCSTSYEKICFSTDRFNLTTVDLSSSLCCSNRKRGPPAMN
jgi:hypothetical protein